jgi:hypothetical protein
MVYLITYDLKAPDRDYNSLFEEIKSIGENYHPLESTWFVKSNKSAQILSKKLRNVMDENDYLFIVKINKQDRQGWLPKTAWNWLTTNELD